MFPQIPLPLVRNVFLVSSNSICALRLAVRGTALFGFPYREQTVIFISSNTWIDGIGFLFKQPRSCIGKKQSTCWALYLYLTNKKKQDHKLYDTGGKSN